MSQQREYYSSFLERGVATQDFLQPLEKRKEHVNGPSVQRENLQVAGKNEVVEPKKQSETPKATSWPGLGMQCGYVEFPSNRQNQHANHAFNKRPNPVPSEDDENDSDYNRKKIHQRDPDGKSNMTPRSKHSATEQRRRSKINDRFQMLRELLPQNDQKRDKASFLQEVVDYIQVLQEKVQHYEQREKASEEPVKTGNPSTSDQFQTKDSSLQTSEVNDAVTCNKPPPDMAVNQDNFQTKELEGGEQIVGGVINISAAYSQRLLNTLTSAFQSSGLDLSQAHISVRIELGNPSSSSSTAKSRPSNEA